METIDLDVEEGGGAGDAAEKMGDEADRRIEGGHDVQDKVEVGLVDPQLVLAWFQYEPRVEHHNRGTLGQDQDRRHEVHDPLLARRAAPVREKQYRKAAGRWDAKVGCHHDQEHVRLFFGHEEGSHEGENAQNEGHG